MHHLQRVGPSGRLFARVRVPRRLQHVLGSHLRKALGTSDLETANRIKHAVIHQLKAKIASTTAVGGPLDREAQEVRREVQAARAAGDEALEDVLEGLVGDRAQRLADQVGLQQAKRFVQLATSASDPLSVVAQPWQDDLTVTGGTRGARRRALLDLLAFIGGDAPAAAITDDTALDFAEHLRGRVEASTARGIFSKLSDLWRWMGERRHVPRAVNPFREHRFQGDPRRPKKRAYTEAELLLVLNELRRRLDAPPTPNPAGPRPESSRALADLVVILLGSACRAEEVAGAVDVPLRDGAGWITVQAKKGARIRRVVAVVHPAALAVLERRPRVGTLFPEEVPAGPDARRSANLVRRFGAMKAALGLSIETDTHSLRRYAITTLERANIDPIALARYVGHAVPGLALSVYSAGASEAQMLATARAIRFSLEIERALAALV